MLWTKQTDEDYYYIPFRNLARIIIGANQPTDQPTEQKQYIPHYYSGGHNPPPGGHVFLPIQTIIKLNLRSPSLTQMNRSQDGYKLCNFHFQDMALDTKVTDGQTDSSTDSAKTISLRLWRGIYTHTKFQ
ncbi:hypothetical protein DPMN_007354 [Dreissena polymorpha]|uniref:Uncharacterized protein n=1 Tax=Dreissena polymorpha TaxID=45954 RepID=A0A9D4MX73_DREPO|nr:hypothetical protein DPMN_007354 [Dreissena polymorpha]